MKVFEELERLKQQGPSRLDVGICNNVKFDDLLSSKAWYEHQTDCFRRWKEFSGWGGYPVPSFSGHGNPVVAYDAGTEETMWSMELPYGQARWRLLDHCINWFKERDL